MEETYTTISGQTWDQIAYEVYGDEYCCDALMDANRELLDYFVFPEGIVLKLPPAEAMTENQVPNGYPTWRAQIDGKSTVREM